MHVFVCACMWKSRDTLQELGLSFQDPYGGLGIKLKSHQAWQQVPLTHWTISLTHENMF